MSKIFEVFGHPLNSSHPGAISHRKKAFCPFLESTCDGGGNRYLSILNLRKHPELSKHFPDLETVQVGVCSITIKNKHWIVCPRRLLALSSSNLSNLQKKIRTELIGYSGLESGVIYRVWSEVKMKVSTIKTDKESKSFDYTFDYIIAGNQRRKLIEVSSIIGKSERICKRIAKENGYTLAWREGEIWIDDFPSGPVVIVEIMTSSTSGGNKSRRTQIGMAFEDAIISGDDHNGPGINYRQVWARMVSQLIVKSQVGLAWGEKTIWVLQDVLTDYIMETTGLNLSNYLNTVSDEVNILAFGYGKSPFPNKKSGVIHLTESKFFSGPIIKSVNKQDDGGFVDIIKVGSVPPKELLWRSLFLKKPCGTVLK